MKEFLLLIHDEVDHHASWPAERMQQFLKKCETYINNLHSFGNLISAQPLTQEGKTIARPKGNWVETSFHEGNDVIVGYYHIYANDFEEAIEIAKGNPEFEYGTTARIEVREIKTKEPSTGFVYKKESESASG